MERDGNNGQPVVVMVTGIGGGGHGEQILKALKCASTRYKIVGADMNSHSIGLYEVDYSYLLPGANNPDYIDELLKICNKHKVKAVFHGSEPELKVLSQNRVRLENEGIFLPVNPQEVIDLCMNKHETYLWLQNNRFPVPQTVLVESQGDLEEVDFWPVVLKPHIGGGGSSNLFIAQDSAELQLLGTYMLSNQGPFIVQEYIGTVDSEYTVGVLMDMEGEYLNSIAVKRMIMSGLSNRIKVKNRTESRLLGDYLAISSGVSQGQIGKFPEITIQCMTIARRLGVRGAVNIQCRVRDNQVYVFEINPRFSGTTSLRALAGYNEPDILIRKHLLGETINPDFSYKCGYIFRGLRELFTEDVI